MLWPFGARVCRAHRGAGVATGVSIVKHVHHCNAEVDPKGIGHEKAITGKKGQAIAG